MGWAPVLVIFLNVLVNMGVVIWQGIKGLVILAKKIKFKLTVRNAIGRSMTERFASLRTVRTNPNTTINTEGATARVRGRKEEESGRDLVIIGQEQSFFSIKP